MNSLLRLTAVIALSLFSSACSPTLRFKPGQMPPASAPPPELKLEAEQYVSAHIQEENLKEIYSGSELARVKRVVERLSVAAGFSRHQFPVHLVDAGDQVNAAAFNGASVVVYRELLNRVHSDDELATVLGHEIGHILAMHFKDQEEEQERAAAVNVGSSILGSVASITMSAVGLGGASSLAGSVTESATGAIGYGAFVGSFSRTQEYEADHLGLIIMARAGYDPEAAVGLWRRSEEVFGSSDSTAGAFFSTHPASGDRVEKLIEAMPFAIAEEPKGSRKKASVIFYSDRDNI